MTTSDGLIRQSAADWCFFKDGADAGRYYRGLKEIGFSAVEMAAPERFDLARAAGLELANINGTQAHGGLNKAEDHPRALAEIRSTMAVARREGIPQVLVFAGLRAGQADEEGIRHCITALKALAREAEQAKITLTLEVFNRFDHPDYQADNSAYAWAVARGVSSPAVKVLYDIYHMHRMGEDVAEEIATHIELIGHLHVAGSPGRDFPGAQQAIDYRAVVGRVRAAGYRGLWGHEFIPREDSLVELARSCELFRAYGLAR